MRFDHHLSAAFQQQLQATAQKMHDWETQTLIDEDAAQDIATRLQFFDHMPKSLQLSFTGVDGSGEYPLLDVRGRVRLPSPTAHREAETAKAHRG